MRWALVVCLMLLFTGACAQTCTVPNIETGSLDVAGNSPQASVAGVLYFYPSPFGTVECNGTVTGYEYCHQRGSPSNSNPTPFSLLVLESNGQGYTVIFSKTEPERRVACTTGSDKVCCDTSQLVEEEHFLTSPDISFALLVSSEAPLLYVIAMSDGYAIDPSPFSIDSVPSEGTVLTSQNLTTGENPVAINLRSFRFIISTGEVSPLPTPVSTPGVAPPPNPTAGVDLTSGASPTSTPGLDTSGGSSDGGSSDDQSAVAAAVVVPLLVVVAILVVASVLVAVFLWRRKQNDTKYSPHERGEMGIDNVVYLVPEDANEGVVGFQQKDLENVYEQQDEFEMGDLEQHDYAVPDGKTGQSNEDFPYSDPNPLEYSLPVPTLGRDHDPSELQLSMAKQSEEEEIYVVPESNEHALYTQLRHINIKSIPRADVKLKEEIGSGQFGIVSKGEWQSRDCPIEVAVKTLKSNSSQEDKIKFLQEAAIMGQFANHYNVVKLYGVVISGEPKMIVLELLLSGDLREHLLSIKPDGDEDLPHTLLSYCRQIASGMTYLAGKAFVHRDLAARNVLLSEDGTCKIADFGMARDLEDESYYVSHGGKIPVKWTSPEAINYKKYSTASDVWSYGAVMYEIWSLGRKPFEGYTNGESMNMVNQGIRLPPPPGTPRAIYEVMIECWNPEPNLRPSFPTLVQWLFRPDTKLLKWSADERSEHPEAMVLGAELSAGINLHTELQNKYIDTTMY